MIDSIKKLFDNYIVVGVGAVWGWIITFLFPTEATKTATIAVLVVMGLDLITRIFAIIKQSKGLRKAIKSHKLTSAKFAKGTLDKLIIFGVMLVISGCAYQLVVIEELATWFTQVVFTIMFLRDVLSIIENLSEAGVSGLGLFKHVVRKKFTDYVDKDVLDKEIKEKKQ